MSTITLESSNNSDWGKVHFQPNESNLTFAFPCHLPTREIYNFDPDPLIRFKCVLLTIATPIISVVRAVYWLAKSAFLVLAATFRYLDQQPGTEKRIEEIKMTLSDSVRSFKYGAYMTLSALAGIAMPFKYRRYYGELERTLNRQADGPHRGKFYLAICFQRLCVISEPLKIGEDQKIAEKLGKYLHMIGEFGSRFQLQDKFLRGLSAFTNR